MRLHTCSGRMLPPFPLTLIGNLFVLGDNPRSQNRFNLLMGECTPASATVSSSADGVSVLSAHRFAALVLMSALSCPSRPVPTSKALSREAQPRL